MPTESMPTSDMPTSDMIELVDVHKSYGHLEVIRGISLTVRRGEVVCIIGPSGSGKSTLLRCINGLETYQRGDIRVGGCRVEPDRPSIRAIRTQVSMVFQRFNLFPHRTALQNVVEGPLYVKCEARHVALARGRALLERVGLAGREDSYPEKLSGGQQQRVAIARALAMRPEAILFDEPTSSLDPELVGDVLGVMRQLADDGLTMLVVTHEMGFAREVADRVLFIDGGVVVEEGPPRALLTDPQQPRTQDFLRRVLHPI
jgi:polar amino acid transport system ATP-binding protein